MNTKSFKPFNPSQCPIYNTSKARPLCFGIHSIPQEFRGLLFKDLKTAVVISIPIKTALINPVLRKQVEPEKKKIHVFKSMEIHFLLIFYLSTSPVFKSLFSRIFNFRVCLGSCLFLQPWQPDIYLERRLWFIGIKWLLKVNPQEHQQLLQDKSWEPLGVNTYFYPNSSNRSTPHSFIFFSSEKFCLLCVTEVAVEVDQRR